MDWRDITKEAGIEVIWIDNEYSEEGSYIPKCSIYPNGAIVLNLCNDSESVEFVALHETGHLVSGKTLALVNEQLKQFQHNKNESKATRYLLSKVAPQFVEENDYNQAWAEHHRLCEFLNIDCTFGNIQIAQEEIDNALWIGSEY